MTERMGSRQSFAEALTAWLNLRFGEESGLIEETTLLFENGLINSIRILDLIAWVEREIGHAIGDREIRMDNFASVERITAVFVPEDSNVEP